MVEIDYCYGYLVLVNYVVEMVFVCDVVCEWGGDDVLILYVWLIVVSEDFVFMFDVCLGSYLLIGNGDGGGVVGCGLYYFGYDFNDVCFVMGVSYWIVFVECYFV